MKKLVCSILVFMMIFSLGGATLADYGYYTEYNEYGFPVRDDPYEQDPDYRNGRSAFNREDYASALKYFRRSAQNGYAYGQYEYANCLENAWGVAKKNYDLAYEYYFYSAMQGNSKGEAGLGRCYLWGRGTDQDYDLAVEYLQRSADQDDDLGLLWLGYCYEKGCGVARDKGMARYYYQRSSDLGNKSAKSRLKGL